MAVGIAGSPRKNGNSTTLLKAYLEGAAKAGFRTRLIRLNDYTYRGCQGCDRCVRGKPCRVHDGLNKVFPVLRKAHMWAMASPVYYDGVSGQLKMFFDRLRFTTFPPNKLNRKMRGALIITYEDKPNPFYRKVASSLAGYFNWRERADFGKVAVIAEANLGPWNAWKKKPGLLRKCKKFGEAHARELMIVPPAPAAFS